MIIGPKIESIKFEYCYSGFLGYRLVIFVWYKNTLLGTLVPNDKGEWVLRPGTTPPKKLQPNMALRFWEWLQKNIPAWLEQL
jgi:hypothetical protein